MSKSKNEGQTLQKKHGEGFIPMNEWGRDHWSLLGYLECRCVDNGGTINGVHLRHNFEKRAAVIGSDTSGRGPGRRSWEPSYGTRLSGFWRPDNTTDPSRQLPDHDDIDCLDDIEAAGLVENEGTGINPLIRMTKTGKAVAAELRAHKASGGQFAGFADKFPEVQKRLQAQGLLLKDAEEGKTA